MSPHDGDGSTSEQSNADYTIAVTGPENPRLPADRSRSPSGGTQFGMIAPTCNFIGRGAELPSLRRMLIHSASPASGGGVPPSPVVITGRSSIGKSELARKYAHSISWLYAGNVVWVNAGSPVAMLDAFKGLAARLVVEAADGESSEQMAEGVYSRLRASGSSCLVIFDNASDMEHVAKFLPGAPTPSDPGPHTHVLITARNPNFAPHLANRLNLGGLHLDDAVQLIQSRMSGSGQALAVELTNVLDGHPAALQEALEYMSTRLAMNGEMCLTKYLKELHECREILSWTTFHNRAKFVLLGDSFAGKSCLFRALPDGKCVDFPGSTIGVDFISKRMQIQDDHGTVQLLHTMWWDTSGHERFWPLNDTYCADAAGVVLFYDVTSRHSFEQAQTLYWRTRALQVPAYGLVGCKADLVDKRAVSSAEASDFAAAHGVHWCETSAVTGEGVLEAFQSVAQYFCDNYTKVGRYGTGRRQWTGVHTVVDDSTRATLQERNLLEFYSSNVFLHPILFGEQWLFGRADGQQN